MKKKSSVRPVGNCWHRFIDLLRRQSKKIKSKIKKVMVGISQIVGCGVIVKNPNQGGTTADIVTDRFIYNGVNNVFALTATASQIIDIYIDNGVYPDEVPVGATPTVTIDAGLIMQGNIITIKYYKQ